MKTSNHAKIYTAVIEKTGTGFSGYFKEVDGVVSVGDTMNEMKENLQEALQSYLEYLQEKKLNNKIK